MLKHLTIKNYALIRRLDLDLFSGLSVLTGETGAGKSIILGALGLILGNRADNKVLLDKEKKCFIEGVFDIKKYKLKPFFEKHDLDFEDVALLRREIAASGKSRAFINDTPVNLNLLRELGDKLVNIHSQNKTITLNDSNFQLAVLDSFVDHGHKLEDYKTLFFQYKKIAKTLKSIIETEEKLRADQDYFHFQFEELDKAGLKEEEQARIESELELLNNAEEIKTNLTHILQMLDNEEKGVLETLRKTENNLKSVAGFHSGLGELNERCSSCLIELKDITTEIGSIDETVHFDQERIDEINARLDLIYPLQQKHRVKTVAELIAIKNDFSAKLESISSMEGEIQKLRKEYSETEDKLKACSESISNKRKAAIPAFEKNIVEILSELGMPDARFQVEIKETEDYSNDGKDRVRFLFNANKGASLDEVAKIASGGELSRLMLSIKSLVANKNLLPTIIFDEIDMGVSGDVASKVGKIMRQMSENMQVIAITHLPQIASRGQHHYLVYKETDNAGTASIIKEIDSEDRVREIAKMLSGEKVSTIAMENARHLLVNQN
jgi:DNA repair protein RecN (Recombination protein N)